MSELRNSVLQWAGRLVKYSTLAALSDKFGFGYVTPPKEDASQGDQPTQQRVRFMQWFGFRSSPVVKGGECIVCAPRSGATNAVAVAADNLSFGRTDLKEGESQQYSKVPGAEVFLDSDGHNHLSSGTPSGGPQGDVILNGGDARVGRVGDPCEIVPFLQGGKLIVWMNQVEVALNALASGSVYPLSASFTADPGIKIADGAPHVKA